MLLPKTFGSQVEPEACRKGLGRATAIEVNVLILLE
jgi:hypothetical protein